MALNLSRIFKGRTPAESVVTDNVDPDEVGVLSVDGKFGPETESAVLSADVWEHAVKDPGGTADTAHVIGLGEPPSIGVIEVSSATGRAQGWAGIGAEASISNSNISNQDLTVTPVGPDFDATAGQSALQRNAAPGTPFFDEADALFGRASQNLTAQYNPKEIGIDKVQMLNNKNPDLTLRDAAGDLHVGGSGADGARRGGDVQFEDVHVSLIDVEGSCPADLEVLGEPGNAQNPGSGIQDIHPNQGSNYTATDDLWKFRGDSQGGSGTANANRSMGPGEGTLSRLDAGRSEGPGWYVPDMDSDQSGMSASSGQAAGWVNSVEFPNLKAEGAPGETGFASSINDQTPADWNERSVQPGQPGQGFMMQDGELYPRGLRDMEIQMAKGGEVNLGDTTTDTDVSAGDGGNSVDGADFLIWPRGVREAAAPGTDSAQGGPDPSGYTATDDLWKFRGEGPGDETARSMQSGQQGQGFMMQDGELYPRGLRDMEIELGKGGGHSDYVGETEKNLAPKVIRDGKLEENELAHSGLDSETQSLQGASLQGTSLQGSSLLQRVEDYPGYTATDDLWKFRDEAQNGSGTGNANRTMGPGARHPDLGFEANSGELVMLEGSNVRPGPGASGADNANRTMQPGTEHEGFMMQDGELYPRGLRDMEIELGKGGGQGSSVQAGDDAGRPHEAMTLNFRETALGGPDTTERFKVEIEGVAFTSDGSDGGENARSAGPRAAGFRPNPVGDGTTQHFQAMPELDASGNSVVDAADYTLWRDNLRGSNPPEGLLPFIEQSNLVGGARFNGSEDQIRTLMDNLQQKGLIDTSTGEVVWADVVGTQTEAVDPELAGLISWLRSTQPPGGAGTSGFRFQGLPGDTADVVSGDETARSIGPDARGFFRPNPTGDGTTQQFAANASKNEVAIESLEVVDDDGPSTFLDGLGDTGGPETQETMSLNFEEIKIVNADPAQHADADVDFDALDSDVDVP